MSVPKDAVKPQLSGSLKRQLEQPSFVANVSVQTALNYWKLLFEMLHSQEIIYFLPPDNSSYPELTQGTTSHQLLRRSLLRASKVRFHLDLGRHKELPGLAVIITLFFIEEEKPFEIFIRLIRVR